jgi:hypothetical protein
MNKRERKLAKRERELAKTEAALARECPKCHTEAGVWCGPVLETFNPYAPNNINPWMHEARY